MYDYTTVEPKDSTNQKAIVYLHNNQVGQMQYAFNSDGQMIYERVQTPFGETMGEINAYDMKMPVRFPGQYYDSETGFNQNWNRDYDPSLWRYIQSDPIGLGGGINTFGYVGQNPLSHVDKLGLLSQEAIDILCEYLRKNNFGIGAAQGGIQGSREKNGYSNLNEGAAENFATAAGGQSPGGLIGIIGWNAIKIPGYILKGFAHGLGFENIPHTETGPSLTQIDASIEGLGFQGYGPDEWKKYCEDCESK